METKQKNKYSFIQVGLGGLLGNPLAALFMVSMNASLRISWRFFCFFAGAVLFIAVNILAPAPNEAVAALGYALTLSAILFINYLIMPTSGYETTNAQSWLNVLIVCLSAQTMALLLFLFL